MMSATTSTTRSNKEINQRIKRNVGDLLAMGTALGLADLKGTPRKISFRCPLHGGCSAGASIKDGEPVWHCFGCDEGGDYFGLVAAATGLVDWPQIRETAARIAGVNLPTRDAAYEGPFPDENHVRVEDLIWIDALLAAAARMDLVDPAEEVEPADVPETKDQELETEDQELETKDQELEMKDPEPVEAEHKAEPAAPAPPAREAEYVALWERCMRLDDPQVPAEVLAYLCGRALPPAELLGATPAQDLVRVLPQDVPLPSWAAREGVAWSVSKHWVIVRIYDTLARLAGLRARSVDPGCPAGGKEMVGGGVKLSGTVLVDAPGELVLRLGPEKMGNALKTTKRQLVVLIAEGVPDFLTLAIWAKRWRATPAAADTVLVVFGTYSGGWTQGIADRLPTGARVILRNHSDKGGCGYRDEISETLWARRCAVEVRHPDGIPTTKKLPDENDDLVRFGLGGIDPLAGNTARPAPPRGGWRMTDSGLAERLVHHHGADLRFCPKQGGFWLAWDGTRWERQEKEHPLEVERRALLSARAIAEVDAPRARTTEGREALESWALRAEGDGMIGKTIHRARALREVEIRPEALDANFWHLGCSNGVLDLRTGRFLSSSRGLYITKKMPVDWDPAAKAPIWERTLLEIFEGDIEVVEVFQRSVGYALTGDTMEKLLVFLHGPGGDNGKSVVMSALVKMFGDYAGIFNPTMIFNRSDDRHMHDVAELEGIRLALISETEETARLTANLVKRITGGADDLKADKKHRDARTFAPTHHLFVLSNYPPVLPSGDVALARRVLCIPFLRTFAAHEQDKKLPWKLADERPGILAWAVRGLQAYLTRGIDPPAKVIAHTEKVRASGDVMARFLDEECERGVGYEAGSGTIYEAYTRWHEASGEKGRPLPKVQLGEDLRRRGFVDGMVGPREKRQRVWRGLRLRGSEAEGKEHEVLWEMPGSGVVEEIEAASRS